MVTWSSSLNSFLNGFKQEGRPDWGQKKAIIIEDSPTDINSCLIDPAKKPYHYSLFEDKFWKIRKNFSFARNDWHFATTNVTLRK